MYARAFYACLSDTIEAEELAEKVSGGMSVMASALGVSSLIPIVGTVTGLVGITTDAASRVAQNVRENKACWSVAVEAARVLAKHRIAHMAAQLGKTRG